MSHFNQVADRYDAYAHVQQSILKVGAAFLYIQLAIVIFLKWVRVRVFTEHLLSLQAQSILPQTHRHGCWQNVRKDLAAIHGCIIG